MKEIEKGILVGTLIGEGHFGGDGKQPQVTLRMHLREKPLFDRLMPLIPGSKLFGPYFHGGRKYYQWMVRGAPLKNVLVPLLDEVGLENWSDWSYKRFKKMKEDYKL